MIRLITLCFLLLSPTLFAQVIYPPASGGGGGSGTVTSVGSLSPLFTTSSASTTPAFSLNAQSGNLVFAGPASGSAAAPTFRTLVANDIPAALNPTTFTSVTAGFIGKTYYANTFPGTDPSIQINNCLIAAEAAGGGVCNAQSFTGSSLPAFTEQINVGVFATVGTAAPSGLTVTGNINGISGNVAGSTTCNYDTHGDLYENATASQWYVCQNTSGTYAWMTTTNAGNVGGVTLLLPSSGIWYWNLTDGTSAGILQRNATSIVGPATGGGGGPFGINALTTSVHMAALYETDPNPPGGDAYVRASGMNIENTTGGGTFAHGVMWVQNLFDESSFDRITAVNLTGDAGHISNVCCGTSFTRYQFTSNYGASGGTPLTFDGGDTATFMNGTVNAAGTGHPNINVLSGNYEINFYDDYSETGNTSADATTPVVEIAANGANLPIVTFDGGDVNMDSSKPCFNNPTIFGLRNAGWCNPINYSGNFTTNQLVLGGANTETSTSGAVQSGQAYAGATTFTPTTVGWYRVYSGIALQGEVDINQGFPNEDIIADVTSGWYSSPGSVNLVQPGTQWSSSSVVSKIEVSGNNATTNYLDLYVANVSTPSPITVTFRGQGIVGAGIVTAPVVGSTPTTYGAALYDLTNVETGSYAVPSLGTSGPFETTGLTSNYGLNLITVPALSGALLVSGNPVTTTQIISAGSAPTVANGAGAGTSPGTATITGNNLDSVISINTGTATTASSTLATITFNGTLTTAPKGCLLQAQNAAASKMANYVYTTAPTTSSWTIAVDATAVTASTAMIWYAHCE